MLQCTITSDSEYLNQQSSSINGYTTTEQSSDILCSLSMGLKLTEQEVCDLITTGINTVSIHNSTLNELLVQDCA